MAFPIVIANVSHTLVSLVDTLMVGTLRGVEDVPLAALGAATSVFLFLFLTFSSLVQGVQVLAVLGRVELGGIIQIAF